MKIAGLFLTNFCLVHGSGKEEQSCGQVVVLFQKYPELRLHFPMFYDITLIIRSQDSLYLIGRKLARHLASIRPVLWSMKPIVNGLEKQNSASKLLLSLYCYIIGGNIYQGYREGLREFGQVRAQE